MAIKLDGGDEYISMRNESVFDFEINNPFSFECWIYIDVWAQQPFIFEKRLTSGTRLGYRCYVDNLARIQFSLVNGTNYWFAQSTAVTTGQWIFLTVTYDGSNAWTGVSVYQNGVSLTMSQGTFSGTVLTILNNETLKIGANIGDGGYQFFDGYISEIRVWDIELTQAQTQIRMPRRIFPQSNLVGYWRCDEGKLDQGPASSTLVDLSGNDCHGDDQGSMTDSDYVDGPPLLWNTGD